MQTTYETDRSHEPILAHGLRSHLEVLGIDQLELEAEASNLIANREQFSMAPVGTQERRDNAKTAIMEALTASGFLSRIEITGTSLNDINTQVLGRLLKGWDPDLPAPELQRRFYEICEELVIEKVQPLMITGELPLDTEVFMQSDIALGMDAKTTSRLGYRQKNNKGMGRSTLPFRMNPDGTFTRVIEQVSRSNSGITVTGPFYADVGIELDPSMSPDVAAMARPTIYSRADYADGIVDIERTLDGYMGPGIRYGDIIDETPNSIPYENLREESARREAEIENYIDDLALLEAQLEAKFQNGEITRADQRSIYTQEVDRILTAICTIHPDYAEDTYGPRAAPIFWQASRLVAQGRTHEATILLKESQHLKEKVRFCGVEIDIEEAKKQGLEVNDYGELVEKGKKFWKFKRGVCQVETCSTRPGKTMIGPCNVCKDCERLFDKGVDPTKVSLMSKFLTGLVTYYERRAR